MYKHESSVKNKMNKMIKTNKMINTNKMKHLNALANICLTITMVIVVAVMYFTVFADRACDFDQFWAASKLASENKIESIYDADLLFTEIQKINNRPTGLTFRYPPVAIVLMYPIAWLPHSTAFVLWSLIGCVGFFYIVKRLSPAGIWTKMAMASPAFLLNIMYGNNGLINVVLLSTSLLTLNSFPFLAGALAGILAYKPHMAFLLFFLFLVGRHYKALIGFTVTLGTLIVLSWLLWGLNSWEHFLGMLYNVSAGKYIKYVTPYSIISIPHTLGVLGSTRLIAYVLQILVSLYVVCTLFWVIVIKKANIDYLAVLILTGTMLFSPYIQIYDLILLNLSILWYIKILYDEKKVIPRKMKWFLFIFWTIPFFQIPVSLWSVATVGVYLSISIPFLLIFYTLTLSRLWYNNSSKILV